MNTFQLLLVEDTHVFYVSCNINQFNAECCGNSLFIDSSDLRKQLKREMGNNLKIEIHWIHGKWT